MTSEQHGEIRGAGVAMLEAAHAYLDRELGPRAPTELREIGGFDEAPLDGEGSVMLFAFTLPTDCRAAEAKDARPLVAHCVVVGKTEPNYYPAYGLGPDDAYSLHIGTRFALGAGLAVAPPTDEPHGAADAVRSWVEACNPGVPLEQFRLAGLFRSDEQLFAVYSVTLAGRDAYCFGADCPPGFGDHDDLPPQVSLRLHLGRVIRAEARREARREAERAAADNPGGRPCGAS